MADWVVDTNVLVVATRCYTGPTGPEVPVTEVADLKAVFDWLAELQEHPDGRPVLDTGGFIMDEYRRNLGKNTYGRMVIADKITKGRCVWVEVVSDDEGTFIPHENGHEVFDLEDRKMVAAALEAPAPIANACDTDWCELEHRGALCRLGVTVHFIIDGWCRAKWREKSQRC